MYIVIRHTNISIFRLLLHTSYLPSPYLGPMYWLMQNDVLSSRSSHNCPWCKIRMQSRVGVQRIAAFALCPNIQTWLIQTHSITLNHHTLHFAPGLKGPLQNLPVHLNLFVCPAKWQLTPWAISPKYSHYDIVDIAITCYCSVNQMPLASPTLCRI